MTKAWLSTVCSLTPARILKEREKVLVNLNEILIELLGTRLDEGKGYPKGIEFLPSVLWRRSDRECANTFVLR